MMTAEGRHLKPVIQLGTLLCTAASACLAGTWSGALVDARCYRSELDNVAPTQSMTYATRDMGYSVRYCSPNVKTKTFAVVEDNWNVIFLDMAGNAKAVQLVRQAGNRRPIEVTVTGGMNKNTVKADSISRAEH